MCTVMAEKWLSMFLVLDIKRMYGRICAFVYFSVFRSTDMWSVGCLIWEVFNGSFTKNTSLKSPGKVIMTFLIC